MDRLTTIIGHIDTALKAFYFKDTKFFGLVRQEPLQGVRRPFNGKENASFNEKQGLMIYHRLLSSSEAQDVNAGFGTNVLLTETINMSMVVFGNQTKLGIKNTDGNPMVADDLKNLTPNFLTVQQTSDLEAQNISIKFGATNYDKAAVFTTEFPDSTKEHKIAPDDILFSIAYSVVIKYFKSCKTSICA